MESLGAMIYAGNMVWRSAPHQRELLRDPLPMANSRIPCKKIGIAWTGYRICNSVAMVNVCGVSQIM